MLCSEFPRTNLSSVSKLTVEVEPTLQTEIRSTANHLEIPTIQLNLNLHFYDYEKTTVHAINHAVNSKRSASFNEISIYIKQENSLKRGQICKNNIPWQQRYAFLMNYEVFSPGVFL